MTEYRIKEMEPATIRFHEGPRKSRLKFIDGTVIADYAKPMPNVWRRFWYWFLLGWTWENIK